MNDSNILTDREKLVQLETRVSILETDSARLKDELAVYQAATITANKKLDQMLMAIVGNDELKIRGLMQRFETLEGVVELFQQWRWRLLGGFGVAGAVGAAAVWVLDKSLRHH